MFCYPASECLILIFAFSGQIVSPVLSKNSYNSAEHGIFFLTLLPF